MAEEYICLIQKEFGLNEEEAFLMSKTMRRLTREDRRFYFSELKQKEKLFKNYFKLHYESLDPEKKMDFIDLAVNSMFKKGGEPDISDSAVMSVVGRIQVYNRMRDRAEKEGHKLNLLVNFGGMGTVIMLVGGLTAIILFLLSK